MYGAKKRPGLFPGAGFFATLAVHCIKECGCMGIAIGSIAIVGGIGAAIYFAIKKWG